MFHMDVMRLNLKDLIYFLLKKERGKLICY